MEDLEKYRDILNHQRTDKSDDVAEFLIKASKAKLPASKHKEDIWKQIESSIDEPKKKQKTFSILPLIGIAASITLIAVYFIFLKPSSNEVFVLSTPLAQTKEVSLPDGSIVQLNASSKLEYNQKWERQVNLEGEAFFEVKKGSRFEVNTANGKITVLGTSFNVYARGSQLEVACKTGLVNVAITDKSFSENISPGEVIILKEDTVKKETRIVELMGKWHTGEFYFDNQPFNDVLNELHRQFGMEFLTADTVDQKFTGFFNTNSVEQALDMVCLPLDLSYEKVGEQNYIIRKNY